MQCEEISEMLYLQMEVQHIEQAAQLCLEEGWNVDAKLLLGYYEDSPDTSLVVSMNERVIGELLLYLS